MNKIKPQNSFDSLSSSQSDEKNTKCLDTLSKIYDVSLDNFPILSFFSFLITITSFILSCYHLREIEPTFIKYKINTEYNKYYIYFLMFITVTHLLSFFHSLSVSIIETIREWTFNRCKKFFRKYKKIIQRKSFQKKYNLYQTIWGIFGTISLFSSYLSTLTFLVLSSITTVVVYILTYSCREISNKLQLFIDTSNTYINKAKFQLENANNITDNILYQYQEMVNLQKVIKESSMQKINEIYTVSENLEYNNIYSRKLLYDNFNPEVEIANGKNYLQVLNKTIIRTEQNVGVYIKYGKYYEEMCYDFSDLYDHFYYIFISFVLLVLSSYFIFTSHSKYFSIYNYIIKLVDNDIES